MRAFLVILFAVWFMNLFLPWWSALIPCILFGAWLTERARTAFTVGFTAGGLAWLIQAFYIHIANQGILTARVAEMLQVHLPIAVLAITFLTGALITGSATLFGNRLKTVLRPVNPD